MADPKIPEGVGFVPPAEWGESIESVYGSGPASRGVLGEYADANGVAYGDNASAHGLRGVNVALAAQGSVPYISENELQAEYMALMRLISKNQTDNKRIMDESSSKSSVRSMEAAFESFKLNKDAAAMRLQAARSAFAVKMVGAGVGVGMGAAQGLTAASAGKAGTQNREIQALQGKNHEAQIKLNDAGTARTQAYDAKQQLNQARPLDPIAGNNSVQLRQDHADADQNIVAADARFKAADTESKRTSAALQEKLDPIIVREGPGYEHRLPGREQELNSQSMAYQGANTASVQGIEASANLAQQEQENEANDFSLEAGIRDGIKGFYEAQAQLAVSASSSTENMRQQVNSLFTQVANSTAKMNG